MPIVESSFLPSLPFRQGHLNTIYGSLFRPLLRPLFQRQRYELPDQDFIDVDWSKVGAKKLIIAVHGLEGSSDSRYMQGVTGAFNQVGWDVAAFHFRSCSGELNRTLQSYHMGATGDLRWFIDMIDEQMDYDFIIPIGYSLGGNVVLRYLAEEGNQVKPAVCAGIAFSVPIDIPRANISINHWSNWLYLQKFLLSLNRKAKAKIRQFPEAGPLPPRMPRNFDEFDEWFTGPIHGYAGAMDYWTRCSSLPLLPEIRIPTLLVNAADDSFLSPSCFPNQEARLSNYLFFEQPAYGGHCGFVQSSTDYWTYADRRAIHFLEEVLDLPKAGVKSLMIR